MARPQFDTLLVFENIAQILLRPYIAKQPFIFEMLICPVSKVYKPQFTRMLLIFFLCFAMVVHALQDQ
jgi:hypothetical protein